MIWVFVRGPEQRVCETRLAQDIDGYELAFSDSSGTHVERFTELAQLLRREHEVVAAWRAQGWRPGPAASRRRPDHH